MQEQLVLNNELPKRAGWNTNNIFWISLVHLVAIAAIPYFTWSGFFAVLIGVFVLAPIGINVGYHRLLCHRSFRCPRWVRNSLVTLGAIIGAGPPIHWTAMHRVHHRHSDSKLDPHDSTRGFWYSHVWHMFVIDEHEEGQNHLTTYAPDLLKDSYLNWLNRRWIWLALATLPALFILGGLPMLLWGGFVRIAVMWHVMWFVNSASHLWGYRNYEVEDRATNCWWVGILAAGEGWHNNHHAYPSCAAHGHKWWEIDVSYLFIRGLEFLGLASEVKRAPIAPR